MRKSLADPAWDASINVGGTINVLEAARTHGVGRVVNTSTGGAIYGDAEHDPAPRATPPLPEAAYGQSKLAAEGYLGLYERLYGLNAVTLRYGNVYGPRQDPLGEAGVIAIFCGKLADGGPPTVYGDGTQTRDYVYVGDVVAANLAARRRAGCAARSTSAPASRRACSSSSELLRELGGRRATSSRSSRPPASASCARSCLDITPRARELGWSPAVAIARRPAADARGEPHAPTR